MKDNFIFYMTHEKGAKGLRRGGGGVGGGGARTGEVDLDHN